MSASVPIDLPAYLLALFALLYLASVSKPHGRIAIDSRRFVRFVAVLVPAFGLVWGGYANDSERYLLTFEASAFKQTEEWLFWVAGYGLQSLVPDPWAIKLLTALALGLYVMAVMRFYAAADAVLTALGLGSVLLLPVTFLGFFNTVRQGLAGALVMLGLVFLRRGRSWIYALFTSAAFLVHQTALVLAAVLYLAHNVVAMRKRKLLAALLMIAPVLSFAAYPVLQVFGIDLDRFVRYAGRHEGSFHYAKFGVAYLLSGVIVLRLRGLPEDLRAPAAAYVAMVALASTLLRYEVPFERLLLYSELVLPFALPGLLAAAPSLVRRPAILWAGAGCAGLALWLHPSVRATLGYS